MKEQLNEIIETLNYKLTNTDLKKDMRKNLQIYIEICETELSASKPNLKQIQKSIEKINNTLIEISNKITSAPSIIEKIG